MGEHPTQLSINYARITLQADRKESEIDYVNLQLTDDDENSGKIEQCLRNPKLQYTFQFQKQQKETLIQVASFYCLRILLIFETQVKLMIRNNLATLTHPFQMSSFTNQISPIILVYYDFKGLGHLVRQLICFLDLPFINIHLDKIEEQRKYLSPQVLSILRGAKINKNELPLIIHEDLFIYDLYPCMSYLCRRFDREDLLGITNQQKAQVQEIVEIYCAFLPNTKKMLFVFADLAEQQKQTGFELMPFIEQGYYHLSDRGGYMYEISQILRRQKSVGWILQVPTILDFYYIESSNYMLGLFGSLDQRVANDLWKENAIKYTQYKRERGETIRMQENLRVMKQYHTFVKSQPYYRKHHQLLNYYKVIGVHMSDQRIRGLQKVWAADYNEVC